MFNQLFQYYISCFMEQGEKALVSICNCSVPSEVVLSEYKKLPPIESISDKEKLELWEYAKEMYPNADRETRLRFIRITYTIGNRI